MTEVPNRNNEMSSKRFTDFTQVRLKKQKLCNQRTTTAAQERQRAAVQTTFFRRILRSRTRGNKTKGYVSLSLWNKQPTRHNVNTLNYTHIEEREVRIRSEQSACWVTCKESGVFTACIKTGASVRPVLKGPDYGKRRYRSGLIRTRSPHTLQVYVICRTADS